MKGGTETKINRHKKKRLGRPRHHWTEQTMTKAWKTVQKHIQDEPEAKRRYRKNDRKIQKWILHGAILRYL